MPRNVLRFYACLNFPKKYQCFSTSIGSDPINSVSCKSVASTSDPSLSNTTGKQQIGAFKSLPACTIDSADNLLRPPYYFENGLRKIKPYFTVVDCVAKPEWIGLGLVDLSNDAEVIRDTGGGVISFAGRAIKLGRFAVNHQVLRDESYVVKANDYLEQVKHRHEPPVIDELKVIEENRDVVVVDKPCSMPVHGSGSHRHNTVIRILKWEHGYDRLQVFYRLDALTSGLLILPRTQAALTRLSAQLAKREVKKEYLCLVEGVFPSDKVTCDVPIYCYSQSEDRVLNGRVNIVDKGGKSALTHFELLGTDGKVSVVKCIPETGRTHQIRVHLQYLGFPIMGDPLYGSSQIFGPQRGKAGEYGKPVGQVMLDAWKARLTTKYGEDNLTGVLDGRGHEEMVLLRKMIGENDEIDVAQLSQVTSEYDPFCAFCKINFPEPRREDMIMYLHCWRYKGPNWEYSTALPLWASNVLRNKSVRNSSRSC